MKNTAENRLKQREFYYNDLKDLAIKEYAELNAIIYTGTDGKSRPVAVGFTGTAGKPAAAQRRPGRQAGRSRHANAAAESAIGSAGHADEGGPRRAHGAVG